MSFIAVIPARYASTRFPGKPLADIAGRPMVVHVCEAAARSGAAQVHVATDDARIADVVREHGFDARLTRSDHATGTDRIAEIADQLALADDAIVVNVQGDEPLIDPALITQVARVLGEHPQAQVSTAAHRIDSLDDAFDPNVVKVVLDASGCALYFSRAPIPYAREAFGAAARSLPPDLPMYRHAGIYGYRAGFLRSYAKLHPCALETGEALEQLRVLWHGYRIAVAIAATALAPGVDTPQDLERVRARFDRGCESG